MNPSWGLGRDMAQASFSTGIRSHLLPVAHGPVTNSPPQRESSGSGNQLKAKASVVWIDTFNSQGVLCLPSGPYETWMFHFEPLRDELVASPEGRYGTPLAGRVLRIPCPHLVFTLQTEEPSSSKGEDCRLSDTAMGTT